MKDRSAIHVVGAAIIREGRCLVARRAAQMSLAGYWEFPGGKVEEGESPRSALSRELVEELGLKIDVGSWLGRGESTVDGREIVLDVYCSTLVSGRPQPSEHSKIRWISATEIDELEWPEADRPILPFLRRMLGRGVCADTTTQPISIVSVDWAKPKKKRAVYTARPTREGWRISRPSVPVDGWSFNSVLSLSDQISEGGSALIAIDAVLGLPALYGTQLSADNFWAAANWLQQNGAFEVSVRNAADWTTASPFFAVKKGQGGLNQFIERAGGRASIYRQLERVTGANPVFATSGIPGSVGSGSIALWREMLEARHTEGLHFTVWPFEAEIDDLSTLDCPIIAESYPRACYGVALASALPAKPLSLKKTQLAERRQRLSDLRAMDWLEHFAVEIADMEAAEGNEDDFDALMQAAALVRLMVSETPLSSHLVDPTWEGGILGTGGLSFGEPRLSNSQTTAGRRSTKRQEPQAHRPRKCPIKGCEKVFRYGRSGWDAHIGSARLHPDWQPEIRSSEHRKAAFREQFSDWFK